MSNDRTAHILAGGCREERAALTIKHTWCYRNRHGQPGTAGRYTFENSQLSVSLDTDTFDNYDLSRLNGQDFIKVRFYPQSRPWLTASVRMPNPDTREEALEILDKILGDIGEKDKVDFLAGVPFVDLPGDATRVDTKVCYNNRTLDFEDIRRKREESEDM